MTCSCLFVWHLSVVARNLSSLPFLLPFQVSRPLPAHPIRCEVDANLWTPSIPLYDHMNWYLSCLYLGREIDCLVQKLERILMVLISCIIPECDGFFSPKSQTSLTPAYRADRTIPSGNWDRTVPCVTPHPSDNFHFVAASVTACLTWTAGANVASTSKGKEQWGL